MKAFKMPDWTLSLPPNATLNTKEVAEIMGFKNAACLNASIAKGYTPDCDFRVAGFKDKLKCRPTKRWTIGYLRKLEKDAIPS